LFEVSYILCKIYISYNFSRWHKQVPKTFQRGHWVERVMNVTNNGIHVLFNIRYASFSTRVQLHELLNIPWLTKKIQDIQIQIRWSESISSTFGRPEIGYWDSYLRNNINFRTEDWGCLSGGCTNGRYWFSQYPSLDAITSGEIIVCWKLQMKYVTFFGFKRLLCTSYKSSHLLYV